MDYAYTNEQMSHGTNLNRPVLSAPYNPIAIYSCTLEERIRILPEPQRSRVTSGVWQTCEVPHCYKRFHLKPWTQFGPRHGALCTRDSRNLLVEDRAMEALNTMERQLAAERHEKAMKRNMGQAQDMDDDVPVMNYWQSNSSIGFGPAANAWNSTASNPLTSGLAQLEFPRFGQIGQPMDADPFYNVDSTYAQDYLSAVDPDSLIAEVDEKIGNSHRSQGFASSQHDEIQYSHDEHEQSNDEQQGAEYQYDEDEEEVVEEDGQRSETESVITEQEYLVIDAAAAEDDGGDGDYMDEDE